MSAAASSKPAPEAPSHRDRQRAETRERLFEAAVAEFRRVGFSGAQIPRIAEAAGVVRGTFYFHFPSKEHVLLEISERSQAGMAGAIREIAVGPGSLDRALTQLVDGSCALDASFRGSSLLRDMLSMHVRAPLQAEAPDGDPPVVEQLERHITAAVAAGEVREGIEPRRLAVTILTSVFGVIVAGRPEEGDRREELELLVDVLLHGMRG